jgi:formylglycine-generating enzyme required for sulfatase activity
MHAVDWSGNCSRGGTTPNLGRHRMNVRQGVLTENTRLTATGCAVTVPVQRPWGHNPTGNVWEWCADW